MNSEVNQYLTMLNRPLLKGYTLYLSSLFISQSLPRQD
jgi:hypothetical protein